MQGVAQSYTQAEALAQLRAGIRPIDVNIELRMSMIKPSVPEWVDAGMQAVANDHDGINVAWISGAYRACWDAGTPCVVLNIVVPVHCGRLFLQACNCDSVMAM